MIQPIGLHTHSLIMKGAQVLIGKQVVRSTVHDRGSPAEIIFSSCCNTQTSFVATAHKPHFGGAFVHPESASLS
jgi:hypothetical protein